MAVTYYGVEDRDKIDWLDPEEAEAFFAAYPGEKLKRPSKLGYQLLGKRVPEDLR